MLIAGRVQGMLERYEEVLTKKQKADVAKRSGSPAPPPPNARVPASSTDSARTTARVRPSPSERVESVQPRSTRPTRPYARCDTPAGGASGSAARVRGEGC